MAARVPEFIREYGRVLRRPVALGSLLAAAALTGCFFSIGYVFIAENHYDRSSVIALLLGLMAGGLLASAQHHPRRSLGLVPYGLLGLCISLGVVAILSGPSIVWVSLVGFFFGVVGAAVRRAYWESLPENAHVSGSQLLVHTTVLIASVMVLVVSESLWRQVFSSGTLLWVMTGVSALAAAFTWWLLFREALEQAFEVLLWPMYRIRGFGPGIADCPRTGPLLVVANHSSWLDPLWLGKVIPRRLIPMMTSSFYDLPVLRWLMTRVVHAIRVQDSEYRRDVPELLKAIAALDRGECVVIFPEGRLRRREEQPLRQFGQGVWHILSERPSVPVMICWIEGGWGSYMSFFRGPPLVNKRPDWWRAIRVGASEPQLLSADVLADDRLTRSHCMRACLDARTLTGAKPFAKIEPLPSEPVVSVTSDHESGV
jgi:1-acyl-sn-glycerol-3-phosphate acyltransferase